MRTLALFLAATTALGACSRKPGFMRRAEPERPPSDSLYWKAVLHLDALNQQGSNDSAIVYLDRYLAGDTTQTHRLEALVMRRLARDAIELAKVEAELRQAKSTEPDQPTDAAPRADREAVREIQRLKEALSKANAELERIRKRLASPKPPDGASVPPRAA